MKLHLDVFGDVQISRELLRVRDHAADMKPAFDSIHDDFLSIEQKQFATQGAYASGGWAPLAASTIRDKIRRGLDLRILHATLALMHSLTSAAAPGHVYRATADEMFVGTNVTSDQGFPYPAVHQNPKQGQTQRRPVELTETDRQRWMRMLQRYVMTGMT